jgi:hypothetical protein
MAQNALNQNRAEQHAPVTPIRDATITPHANTRDNRLRTAQFGYGNATAVARMRQAHLLSG